MLIIFNGEQGMAMGNARAIRYEKVTGFFPDFRGDGVIRLFARLDDGTEHLLCSEGSESRIVERMINIENEAAIGRQILDLRGTVNPTR